MLLEPAQEVGDTSIDRLRIKIRGQNLVHEIRPTKPKHVEERLAFAVVRMVIKRGLYVLKELLERAVHRHER